MISPDRAATALGVQDFACVNIAEQTTAQVPDSGPTVASRTCMVVGGLVEKAARALKEKLVADPGHKDVGTAAPARLHLAGAPPSRPWTKRKSRSTRSRARPTRSRHLVSTSRSS